VSRILHFWLFAAGLLLLSACAEKAGDIVLRNGKIYTMDERKPWGSAVVITGNKITAVLTDETDAERYIGASTRVIDLKGRFAVPGFIDAHVHFAGAGAMLNNANLLTVSDAEGLEKEMRRVVGLLDEGEWISGGHWGAYEQWAQGAEKAGSQTGKRWEPTRWMIDSITSANPCLLNSFDGALFLANTAALRVAGLETARLPGMKVDARGRATGLINRASEALTILRKELQKHPKSESRLLNESRAALKMLAEYGIVEVHDITDIAQMSRYVKLREQGELTARIWMRADLSRAAEFTHKGIKTGTHPVTGAPDHFLRWGAFKGYIDGIMGNHTALFFEPYDDQPNNYGRYRVHTSDDPEFKTGNMEKMYGYLKIAHQGGFVANVHAIGDKGVALMLDTYERLMKDIGESLEGYRVIHAQVIRPEDFVRFKKLRVIAEVNPYHVADDMRWMEERIGHERCKGAYAFKSLLDNGAILTFGSDWAGSGAADYYNHPRYLLHAAVTRTTINRTPEGGWFPEQKISMHEALKAYTINAAYATFEQDIKGSITEGKLADLTVLDQNLMEIDPMDILKTNVEMTIVDGRIVFEK